MNALQERYSFESGIIYLYIIHIKDVLCHSTSTKDSFFECLGATSLEIRSHLYGRYLHFGTA